MDWNFDLITAVICLFGSVISLFVIFLIIFIKFLQVEKQDRIEREALAYEKQAKAKARTQALEKARARVKARVKAKTAKTQNA